MAPAWRRTCIRSLSDGDAAVSNQKMHCFRTYLRETRAHITSVMCGGAKLSWRCIRGEGDRGVKCAREEVVAAIGNVGAGECRAGLGRQLASARSRRHNVERLMPSRRAASSWLPPASMSACLAFSRATSRRWVRRSPPAGAPVIAAALGAMSAASVGGGAGTGVAAKSSGKVCLRWDSADTRGGSAASDTIARSMTLPSSRTLPGQ